MPQFYILIGLAIVLTTVLLITVWRWLFPPKQKSKTKEYTKKRLDVAADRMTARDLSFVDNFKIQFINKYKGIPVVGVSQKFADDISGMVGESEDETKRTVTPEEIKFNQLMVTTIFVLAVIVVSLIFKYALLLLVVTPLVFGIPVSKLKGENKDDLDQIVFQFPDFYDAVFCQYSKRNVNILMADVVESFLPVSNSAFKKMLKRFLIDLESGEDYALRQLDTRYYTSPTIHKFCSIMRLRLKGDETAFLSLQVYRETLQAEVKEWLLSDLKRRKHKANKIIATMITTILSIVMIVYFTTFITMTTGK